MAVASSAASCSACRCSTPRRSGSSGFILPPGRILLYAAATYALLLGYNRYAGLHQDATWREVAADSVEEMGIGMVLSALFLIIIGRITSDMALVEVVGKTVVAGMTVAIGVSVGTTQLGGSETSPASNARPPAFHQQVVVAAIAAVLVSGSIAPTDEVMFVSRSVSAPNVIALAALSFLLTAAILFYVDFVNADRHTPRDLTLVRVIGRSASAYAVALAASAVMLWFFQRFDDASMIEMLSATVSLGLMSTLGASAGRLLLQ